MRTTPSGVVWNAINTLHRAIPKLDRINVILRPFLSARRPQNGAAKQTIRNVIPVAKPDHKDIPSGVLTPKS